MSLCPRCQTENPLAASSCQSCGMRLMSWGTMLVTADQQSALRPQVTLRVVKADGGPEVVFAFRKDQAVAGSAGDILLMDDPFVARNQARFTFSGPVLTVDDIGGGSGVFARVKAERQVHLGQEIRCGRQRLVLEEIPPAPTPRVWGSPDPGCRVRLVQLLDGGRRGDAFPLREGENLIGREAGDITFPGDGFVSGRHAVLRVQADRMTLRDVGSSNGTFVRLDQPTNLENGDQLLMGRHLLKVDMTPAA